MTDIIKFYSHNPLKPYHQFSIFYYLPFMYSLPTNLNLDYPKTILCETSEKAIMLSKAALMNDKDIFFKIKKQKILLNVKN